MNTAGNAFYISMKAHRGVEKGRTEYLFACRVSFSKFTPDFTRE